MGVDSVYQHRVQGGWLLAAALLGSCGAKPSDGILVTLSNLPARAVSLSIQGQLDNKPALSAQQVTPAAAQFGVVLAPGTTGHLVMTIQALDADGCLQALGVVDTTLSGQAIAVTVPLAAQSPRACGSLPACAAGTICTDISKPAGVTNLWGLWASSPSDVWAVGDNGLALHYDGTKWSSTVLPMTANYFSVWGSSSRDVWAVGQGGYIFHYDGQTWRESTSTTINDLMGVFGISATDVWAVGLSPSTTTPGEFLHFDGLSWKKVTTGYNGSLLSVWASSPSDITASGSGGLLLHYNGTTWNAVASGTTNDLRSVWGFSSSLVFAAGTLGTVLRNSGTGWTKIPVSGYSGNLYGIGGDQSTVYAVGLANASGNSVKGTAPFDSFTGQNSGSSDLTAVIVGSNGIGWVTGRLGYLGYFDTRP